MVFTIPYPDAMQPQSNKVARQLSSMPTTHRQSVLQAISSHVHKVTADIKHIQAEGQRLRGLIEECPEDVTSKLDWINARLAQN